MKKYLFLLLFLAMLTTAAPAAYGQCAMCRATVENNVNSGENRVGAGLNTGILYLMLVPYACFAVIGFFWYRNSRRQRGRQLVWLDPQGRPFDR